MMLMKNPGFLKDPAFLRAYARALEQEPGTKTRWRAHVNNWAGSYAMSLPGDFVECGVNKAFFSRSIMTYVDFQDRRDKIFYLFDTYAGIVEEQVGEQETAAYKNEYEDTYKFVANTFKDHSNVRVVRGVVPEILSTMPIDRVAYLSVDMNVAVPEKAALEYFWPRLVPGGIIVLDDYAFPGRSEQQKVADEFAQNKGVKVLTLPTGQGIIIKPPN